MPVEYELPEIPESARAFGRAFYRLYQETCAGETAAGPEALIEPLVCDLLSGLGLYASLLETGTLRMQWLASFEGRLHRALHSEGFHRMVAQIKLNNAW